MFILTSIYSNHKIIYLEFSFIREQPASPNPPFLAIPHPPCWSIATISNLQKDHKIKKLYLNFLLDGWIINHNRSQFYPFYFGGFPSMFFPPRASEIPTGPNGSLAARPRPARSSWRCCNAARNACNAWSTTSRRSAGCARPCAVGWSWRWCSRGGVGRNCWENKLKSPWKCQVFFCSFGEGRGENPIGKSMDMIWFSLIWMISGN